MRKLLMSCVLMASGATMGGFVYADGPASAPTAQLTTAPTTQPTTEPAATTVRVQRGSLAVAIDGQGSFDAVDPFEVRLRLKAYGGELAISSIAANGSPVKKGDRLLQIDPAPMKRMLAAVENEDLAARANLEKAEVDAKVSEEADSLATRQQQASLKEAHDSVKWFETVDGPQMLKGVELSVQAAKNQMDDEQDELDQLKKMYKSEELTSATADIVVKRAVRQFDLSKTAYSMARDRANKSTTFNYPVLKQRMYDNLESARQQFALFEAAQRQGKILRQTGLAAARSGAEATALRLADLKADAEKLTVCAPADGIACYGQLVNGVWSGGDPRALRVGEHVAAQMVLMTVYRPGRLRLVLDLPENRFFVIQPGQKVSINPVAFPELKYEGMTDVSPRTAANGGNYALNISTGEVDPRLVPGMKAQVHLDVPLVDNVLLVPAGAVKEGSVSIKTATGIEPRHVMTGRTDGKSIEILCGLHEGDEVLTQPK